jgi:hypothetical protein
MEVVHYHMQMDNQIKQVQAQLNHQVKPLVEHQQLVQFQTLPAHQPVKVNHNSEHSKQQLKDSLLHNLSQMMELLHHTH